MKKIVRLTESELKNIIERSVNKIIKEDVLGNNWHEKNNTQNKKVLNNYESFEDQYDGLPFGLDDDNGSFFKNEHDWGVEGEEGFDPTEYDPDAYIDTDFTFDKNFPTSDNDLYRL